MLLGAAATTNQAPLPLAARPARTQPSLTAACAPCAAGSRLALPFNHLSVRAKWLGFVMTCSRAGARAARHVPTAASRWCLPAA